MDIRSQRREFLRALSAGALGALFRPFAHAGDSAGSGRRPNVVLILTDDQGSVDANCFGAEDLRTPAIDALARRGTRFTAFYVGSSVCSPSRAALLTGRYPQRAGLATNAGRKGLPPEQVTLAELFRGAGYKTAIFGKWHLGEAPEFSPNAQGFDEFFGHKVGCIDNYSHFFYWSGPNRHDLWRDGEEVFEDGSYFPDLVVREAERFLEENRDRPFFLYLPFNMPHYPLQAEPRFAAMYEGVEDPNRRRYAAFVTALDDRIGRVLAKLDALGLRRDTIVVFLSDNGHSVEERAFGGGGSAGPYRGHKFTLWEGGIRLPCIVSWPGKIPAAAVREAPVASMDWFPTLAAYCGVPLPPHRIDGKDIRGVISGTDESPHTELHWMLGKRWAVRIGDRKLVRDGGEVFLADIVADPGESTNLAGAEPATVARLTRAHEAWLRDAGAQ